MRQLTEQEQWDRALAESDRMRIEASKYRQLGFPELARFLNKQADAALKWAARLLPRRPRRTSTTSWSG